MMKSGFFLRRRATSVLGYGLLLGLVGVAALTAISRVGDEAGTLFGNIASHLNISDLQTSPPMPETPPGTPESCADILAADSTATDGFYIIDTDGEEGSHDPFEVYCNMSIAGGGWTVLISSDTETTRSLPYLERFDVVSQTIGDFVYVPSESCGSGEGQGVSWGGDITGGWETDHILINIDYTEIYTTYTGFYNCPTGGLGQLRIGHSDHDYQWLLLTDAHTTSGNGQTLIINDTDIFTNSTTNIENRTDHITVNPHTELQVQMGRFQNYPYTRRLIRQLWVR